MRLAAAGWAKRARWRLAIASVLLAAWAQAAPRAAPYRFANVAIGGGGFVSGLLYQPTAQGLLYARTDVGGAYRWDRGASRWIPLLDWLAPADDNLYGVDSVAVDPRAADRLYLLTGTYTNQYEGNGAVLASTDRGAHFTRSDLPFKVGGNEQGRNNGERLAVDPHLGRILFLGSRTAGLWRSDNHGVDWSKVDGFPDVADATAEHNAHTQPVGVVFVVFDPASGKPGKPTPTLYAGVSSDGPSIYRSTDGGRHWQAVPGQPLGLRPHHMLRASDGSYYLSYGDTPGPDSVHDGAVWKYQPAGEQWTDITPLPRTPGQPSGYGWDGIALDPSDAGTVMVATFGHYTPKDLMFRSRDGGQHWQELFAHSQFDTSRPVWLAEHTPHWIASIAIDPHDGDRAWFVTGYGVWATQDLRQADQGGTVHWRFLDDGLEEIVAKKLVSPASGAPLLSAMYDLDGFRHDDLTQAPPHYAAPPRYIDADDLNVAGQKPQLVVRSGWLRKPDKATVRAAYSLDGGQHWQGFASEPEGMEGQGAGSLVIAADGGHVLWYPRDASHGYLTADFGQHWQPVAGLQGKELVLVADRVDAQRFYALDAEHKTLLVSRDGGAHFAPIEGPLAEWVRGTWRLRLQASPEVAGELYVAGHDGLVRGNDGGQLLQHVSELQRVDAFGFGMAAPGQTQPALYAAGQRAAGEGIFRSIDGGAHWSRIDDDRHRYGRISMITGDPRVFGRVYVGTSGRGIVYGEPATPP